MLASERQQIVVLCRNALPGKLPDLPDLPGKLPGKLPGYHGHQARLASATKPGKHQARPGKGTMFPCTVPVYYFKSCQYSPQ